MIAVCQKTLQTSAKNILGEGNSLCAPTSWGWGSIFAIFTSLVQC